MCSPVTIVQLQEKIIEILPSNGIKDPVSEVSVKESGSKGDGFASSTQAVTITFQSGDDNGDPPAPLHLFVKLPSTGNASHMKMLEDLKAFEKEARFFMEYLPAARELCKATGLGDFLDFYPKCYYGDESMIILENLIHGKGYELLAYELYNFETTVFPLKTLAKQHAVAHAMIQEVGGAEKFFKKYPNLDYDGFKTDTLIQMIVTSCENTLNTNIALLEKNEIEGRDEMLEKLNSLRGTTTEILLDWLTLDDALLVLNHGDYKSTNMMFLKDKETNTIIHHMAIDLQTPRYNSPAMDLTYFLFSSTMHNVRQSRLDDLLDCYRGTLNEVSKQLGHPIELSKEDLLLMVRRKFKFGFFIAMHAIGPGAQLYKNIDIEKVDVADWSNFVQVLLIKWIEEHPEEQKKMARDLKGLMEEYTKLEL